MTQDVAGRGDALVGTGLGKTWGPVTALHDVSLTVRHGTVHCLLGENGAGKSTLCKGIFGLHAFDAGSMLLDGEAYAPAAPAEALRAGVEMIHQHFSLIPTLTVADNLSLGRGWTRSVQRTTAERAEALGEAYGLRVDLNARIEDLSLGQQQQVEIVRCLTGQPSLLLLDEPTAVLNPAEIDAFLKLCRTLADDGHAVVLITHKLDEVMRVADDITVLRQGGVVLAGAAAGHSASDLVHAMIGSMSTPSWARARSVPRPDTALEVKGLRLDRPGGEPVLYGVDFEVGAGELVGIAGVEGNGQSELAAVLSGSMVPSAGSVRISGRDVTGGGPRAVRAAGLAVIPEDRLAEGCMLDLSLAENVLLPRSKEFRRFGRLDRRRMADVAGVLLKEFDVRPLDPYARFGALSGGNQQKVVLARELTLDPLAAVLAVHPTRGLDVGAVSDVLARLTAAAERGVGVLLVSSELPELLAVCTRVLVCYRGRLVGEVDPAGPDAAHAVGALMTGAEASATTPQGANP